MRRLTLLLVLPLAACGDSVSPSRVAAIHVAPPGVVLETGASVQLTAASVDEAGDTITGTAVSWTSSDTTRVRITTGGLLTAIRPGIANVTATAGGVKTEVPVAVLAPVTVVTVIPDTITLHVGNQAFLVAQLTDSAGATLFGRFSTWSVSDSSILRLTSLGPTAGAIQIDALAQGVAQVTVSSGTHADTATVTVLP